MTSPVRVLQVIGSTGLYGAERWILALLHHLPPDRARAAIVNLTDRRGGVSPLVHEARARGLSAMDLDTGGRFNPAGAVRLARLARQQRCAILHSHGYKADVLAVLAARLAGLTVISTPHGWSRERDLRLALYESFGRLVLRFADHVCPLAPELYEGLLRSAVPARKLRLIPNAVDIDEVDGVAPVGERRDGETIVGYVGQLIRRKNVGCLIEAIAQVARERSDVRLVIVGAGPLRGELEQMVARLALADHVRFLGYRADGVGLLKTFDLLALPSWEEGIPRCLMEAMAARVPVVASDIPGNRALVDDGNTGVLFRPDAPGELAATILALIESPERRKAMVERARARVCRDFSPQRLAADYAGLYATC